MFSIWMNMSVRQFNGQEAIILKLFIFLWTAGKLIPVIVYFHGGGFSFFSASSPEYDSLCRQISCETRAVVISVNYRLAPEHKYPAAYDDSIDVLRFLDSDGIRSVDAVSNLELDFGNCFIAGDSAGGNIVHHVARRWAATTQDWKKVILDLCEMIYISFQFWFKLFCIQTACFAPLFSIEQFIFLYSYEFKT